MSLPIAAAKTEQPATPNPWILPERALTVFNGCPEIQRLSHYFLPRILLHQKRVLYLDGANKSVHSSSPALLGTRSRTIRVQQPIRIARAFTCFQTNGANPPRTECAYDVCRRCTVITHCRIYISTKMYKTARRALRLNTRSRGCRSLRHIHFPSPFFPMRLLIQNKTT